MLGRNINSNTLSGINRDNVNQQLIETIQEEILVIETDIDLLKQEQIVQNQNISTNQTNISTNTGNIAINTTAISALQSEQIIQNQNIATNAQNINLNSIDIDDLESEQVIQNSAILANTNSINALGTRTTALEGRADAFDISQAAQDVQISTLQTTVGNNFQTLLDELNDIQQQVYGNDADIVALDIRITENRNKINELEFYQFNILMSLFWTKDESYSKSQVDNLFISLRGTYTVGTIGELKTNLEALISALDTSTAASIANLQGQINSNDTDISNLQGRMLTEEQQTAQQWTAISDLQVFDTSLQNQISGNNTDISALQTKTQHVTSNSTATFLGTNLVVQENITCDKITCRGTVPENPALVITDEASQSMMSFDASGLNAQGNPIIQPGDGIILMSNTGETGVLSLTTNSTTRAGVRISKDETRIFANTVNIRNSDNNVMTTITKATSDSSILAHHGNIHTNSVRHRSIFAGIGVVGSINSSYGSITPLISSMTNFTPTNVNFFVINPGLKLETYSGTNYGGSQNVFNNGLGNFTITQAAIGSVQSIKLFFRNMNGTETQILL